MKITSVSYARLQTLSGHNNERVGATADVEYDAGELPEQAMARLKAWVHEQMSDVRDVYAMREDVEQLSYQKDEIQRDIDRLAIQYEHLQHILQQHGVEIEDLDNIPF